MAHFVYDNTSLFYPKTNLTPLGVLDDPTKFIQDVDWNTLNQAAVDLRDMALRGKYHGFTPQASDPSPGALTTAYIWARDDGALLYRKDATTVELLSSARSVTGTGALGGGGQLTSNVQITHNTSAALPGAYASPSSVTIDQYGHVTAIVGGGGGSGAFGAEDSARNTVLNALTLMRKTSDLLGGDDGIGVGILFQAENDDAVPANQLIDIGQLQVYLSDATDGTEDTKYLFRGLINGTMSDYAELGSAGLTVSNGGMSLPSGAAATPSLKFTAFDTTGFFAAAGPILGVSVAGVEVGRWGASSLLLSQPLHTQNGTVGAPSHSFTNFSTSGFFAGAGPFVGVSVNGTERGRFTTTGMTVTGDLVVTGTTQNQGQTAFPDGTAANPSITFTNFNTSGLFAAAGPIVGVSVGGVEVARWGASSYTLSQPLRTADGSVSAPSHSFTNFSTTGLYASAGPSLNITINGVASVFFPNQAGEIDSAPNTTLRLIGRMNDGASAIAVVLGTSDNYVNASAKLVSIRNNVGADEKAYFGIDGSLVVTGGGVVRTSNGTASAPSLNFSGFTTTGLFGATNILGFSIGGSEIARLWNTGKLALGSTTEQPTRYYGIIDGISSAATLTYTGLFHGAIYENSTVAVNGTQQWSPIVVLAGRGFETTGSTSQTSAIGLQTRPLQGTTSTPQFHMLQSTAGANWTSFLRFSNSAAISNIESTAGFLALSGGSSGAAIIGNSAISRLDAGTSSTSMTWSNKTFVMNNTNTTLTTPEFVIAQQAGTTGSPSAFRVTAAAHTTLTRAEVIDIDLNLGRTISFASSGGSDPIPEQRAVRILAPTYTSGAALGITSAYTVYIDGAPVQGSNVTISNAYALYVAGGATLLGGSTSILGRFRINAAASSTLPGLHYDGNSASSLDSATWNEIKIALSSYTFSTADAATLPSIRITQPTYAAAAASTYDDAATLEIQGGPSASTNVTIRRSWGIYIRGTSGLANNRQGMRIDNTNLSTYTTPQSDLTEVGLMFGHPTAATAGVTTRNPPGLLFSGTAWNTGSTVSHRGDFMNWLTLSSGNPITGELKWGFQANAGGFSLAMSLSNSGKLFLAGEIEIDGALNHDGTTVGFFGTAPASQQATGATLTNNVTAGGTDNQIDNWTDLTTYSNDAAAIRNAIYQLARKLRLVELGGKTPGLWAT